jgi:hypothetical protein
MSPVKPGKRSRLKRPALTDLLPEDGQLLGAEQRLLDLCAIGASLDIADGRPDKMTNKNRIRADFVRFLALGGNDDTFVHQHGVRVKGAWIEGDLDLENCRVAVELTLTFCTINGILTLRDADLFSLSLTGSAVRGMSAHRVHCAGPVALDGGFYTKGTVGLNGARIGGSLICDSSRFEGEDGVALSCDATKIASHVFLRNGFQAIGQVRFLGAEIGLNLECSGGEFKGSHDRALFCPAAKIGGSIFLNKQREDPQEQTPQTHNKRKFLANGSVDFTGANIGGDLYCNGGQFDGGSSEGALRIDGAEIKGSVYLNDGFEAKGTVSLTTSNIKGNLNCESGCFQGGLRKMPSGKETRTALLCDQADIRGIVSLNRKSGTTGDEEQFRALGVVRFVSARIGGQIYCAGGKFEGSEPDGALRLDGADIKGDVSLNEGFSAKGAVVFSKANISGELNCSGGKFEGLIAKGQTGEAQVALVGDQATVGRNLSLNNFFRATGRIQLLGATIGGNLNCSDGVYDGDHLSNLSIEHSEIKGSFFWYNVASMSGPISLVATHVGTLFYDNRSWKTSSALTLDGFRYDRIIGVARTDENGLVVEAAIDTRGLVDWLKKQPTRQDFRPQPWEQLIAVLREMGHDDAARTVAVEKQKQKQQLLDKLSRARLTELNKRIELLLHDRNNKRLAPRFQVFRVALRSWVESVFAAFWQKVYGRAAQYGYRPTLLIVWAMYFAIGFAVLFKIAAMAGVMVPSDRAVFKDITETKDITEVGTFCYPEHGGNWTTCPALSNIHYTQFDPLIYSFDLILPVISTQQTKDWAPLTTKSSNYWRLGLFFWLAARMENLIGWIFGLTFVAIVSGLVKRD